MDYSSAFNTIIPHRLRWRLLDLGLPFHTCPWIRDILMGRRQRFRVEPHTSTHISLGQVPLKYVCPAHESPALCHLYSWLPHCLYQQHYSQFCWWYNHFGSYLRRQRDGGEPIGMRCTDNNLRLNTAKTNELVIDFRKMRKVIQPITINGYCVECHRLSLSGYSYWAGSSLGCDHQGTRKKAQQRLFSKETKLIRGCWCSTSIESIITHRLFLWFSTCTLPHKQYYRGLWELLPSGRR